MIDPTAAETNQGLPRREYRSYSPEARRQVAEAEKRSSAASLYFPSSGYRAITIIRRTLHGTWNDGFIHAGNLAYMSVLAMFPFFILGAAMFSAIGEEGERAALVDAVLLTLPPVVANVIEPVARSVIEARSGWLLWVGAAVGLWTVSSLIETIRDILRRAYGTEAALAFWKSRLFSSGIIILSVIILMLSLLTQVLIETAQQFLVVYLPWLDDVIATLSVTRIVPAITVFGSLYFLFFSLAPPSYRALRYPKWPGALLTTVWWICVTLALPRIIRNFFTYDLTYGALSGIMVSLFFFWLVGLGVVIGAELNAALAVSPEEESAKIGRNTKEMKE